MNLETLVKLVACDLCGARMLRPIWHLPVPTREFLCKKCGTTFDGAHRDDARERYFFLMPYYRAADTDKIASSGEA